MAFTVNRESVRQELDQACVAACHRLDAILGTVRQVQMRTQRHEREGRGGAGLEPQSRCL